MLQDCAGSSTYIGVTCNLARRLRQHCGEIKGGAKRTRGRAWRLLLWVEGFRSYAEALQFEWAFQKRKDLGAGATGSSKRGLALKIHRLHALTHKPRWTRQAPEAETIPLRIVCKDEGAFQHTLGRTWPHFITLLELLEQPPLSTLAPLPPPTTT